MWADTDKDSAAQKAEQTFAPNKPYDFSNPADQMRRRITEANQAVAFGSYSTPPIKVFTVCVDQMSGKYMAFLGSDPAKTATADSRLQAVASLLVEQRLIVTAEID